MAHNEHGVNRNGYIEAAIFETLICFLKHPFKKHNLVSMGNDFINIRGVRALILSFRFMYMYFLVSSKLMNISIDK